MNNRRKFLKIGVGFLAGTVLMFGPLFSTVQWVFAKAQKTILPKGTKRKSLIQRNPRSLDTRNLETTPFWDHGDNGS
jgi:hypothetical protein